MRTQTAFQTAYALDFHLQFHVGHTYTIQFGNLAIHLLVFQSRQSHLLHLVIGLHRTHGAHHRSGVDALGTGEDAA